MTRQERLKFCKTCQKREFDFNKGILCSLTHEYAAFEDICLDYETDQKIQILTDYKKEQSEIKELEKIQSLKQRKEKKRSRKERTKRIPEKLRMNDIWLLLGLGLLTVFIVRFLLYANFTYNKNSNSLGGLIAIYLSGIVALLLRKKEPWRFRVFGDMKFKFMFALIISLLNALYILLIHPQNYDIWFVLFSFLITAFLLSVFSALFVVPISLLINKIRRSNDKT